MSKHISVYSPDSNPAVDPPLYHISLTEAWHRIEKGYVLCLSHTAVQLSPDGLRDQSRFAAGGLFRSSWAPRLSDRWLVWQLQT